MMKLSPSWPHCEWIPVPDGRGESGRLFSLMLILQIIAIIAPVVTHVYLSSDRGRYTSSGGDNSVSVGAMEINRRAGANRGNEAAQQRAAGRRSRRQGRAFTFNFYLSSLTHNTQCRNGRWQKVQVINFMFTSTPAAVAATNLWEYVGFKG